MAFAALLLVAAAVPSSAVLAAPVAPLRASLSVRTTTFYPPVDGYRDVARFRARVNRPADLALQLRRTATGPLVRSIDLGRVPAGQHDATWDARDGQGALVAPGDYVVRVVAKRAGSSVRSAYSPVRMEWKHLAEQSAVHTRTANSYLAVTGGCGTLRQLPADAVEFDMVAPEDCARGVSGKLVTHYRFGDYPRGFTTGKVIRPEVLVHADGNHPVGYGTLGVEAWEGGEDQAWLFSYDPSSGDDGQVEIAVDLTRNQRHGRPVRYTFQGSTGDDYVLDGFVLTMRWFTLVPAP